MSDIVDYPAAHSMDATWFAVDEEGFVAEFDTRETGALPRRATTEATGIGADGDGVLPPFDRFYLDAVRAARAMASGARSLVDGLGPAPTRATRAVIELKPASSDQARGYRDASRSTAEDLIPADKILVLRENAPRVIATSEPLELPQLTALRVHPDVAAIWLEEELPEILRAVGGHDGVFVFEHDAAMGEGGGPGAYRRVTVPEEGIRLADVADADSRGHLARLVLPLKFQDAEHLHLADVLPEREVNTWDNLPLRDTAESRRAYQERMALAAARRQSANRWILLILIGILTAAGIGLHQCR